MRYPELQEDQPEVSQISQALASFGCVLIRQAFEPDGLAPLLQRALQAYAQADHDWEQGQMEPGFYKWLYQFGHVAPYACGRDPEDFSAVAHLLWHSRLKPWLKEAFGPQLVLLYYNTLFRRQGNQTPNLPVPYHQDAQFLGISSPCINIWTPLVPCGQDAPGLEVILKPMSRLLGAQASANQELNGYESIDLGESSIKRLFAPHYFWHPVLSVGDIMIFTHTTIHRTYLTPTMTKSRISLEIRCTSPAIARLLAPSDVLVFLDMEQGATHIHIPPKE